MEGSGFPRTALKGETRKERKEGRKNKKEGKKEEKEVNVQSRWISLQVLVYIYIYMVERVVRAYLYRRVDQ